MRKDTSENKQLWYVPYMLEVCKQAVNTPPFIRSLLAPSSRNLNYTVRTPMLFYINCTSMCLWLVTSNRFLRNMTSSCSVDFWPWRMLLSTFSFIQYLQMWNEKDQRVMKTVYSIYNINHSIIVTALYGIWCTVTETQTIEYTKTRMLHLLTISFPAHWIFQLL